MGAVRKASRTKSRPRRGRRARNSLTIPVYRDRLKARLLAGRLPPALECLLWHYAKGKPKDDLQVTGNERGPLKIIVTAPWDKKPEGEQ